MALICFVDYIYGAFSHCVWVYFSPRMESLETALKIVLPVEKESLLLCGSDLLLHEMAIQEFHLIDADGIYQNLRVNISFPRHS